MMIVWNCTLDYVLATIQVKILVDRHASKDELIHSYKAYSEVELIYLFQNKSNNKKLELELIYLK